MGNKKKKESKKKQKRNKIIGIGIFLFILCIGIAFLYAYLKDYIPVIDKPSPSQSVQNPSPTIKPTASLSPSQIPSKSPSEEPSKEPDVEEPKEIYIENLEQLKEYLEYKISYPAGIYSLSLYDYSKDQYIDINVNQKFDSLSSYRLALVMYAYEESVKTNTPLDTSLSYKQEDYNINSYMVENSITSASVEKLCEYILKYDDLSALNILLRRYGKQNILNYMGQFGISTDLTSFSSKDLSTLVKVFYERLDSNKAGYSQLYSYMQNSFNYKEYNLLGQDFVSTSFALLASIDQDKLTFNASVMADSKNKYLLSLSGKKTSVQDGALLFREINEILNEYFSQGIALSDKDELSHGIIIDNIDPTARAFASKFKSYVLDSSGKTIETYISKTKINFPLSSSYSQIEGITTFRGSNFRDGGGYGKVDIKENKLEEEWSYVIGGMTGFGSIWPGVGWTGQPSIVKWDYDTLQMMNVYDEFKSKEDFVEVIYATLDGNVYFLDLETGKASRDYIYIGVPVKGSLTVDPRGYPLIYVGQGIESGMTNEGEERYKPFGYRIFSLINGQLLHEIHGNDGYAPRTWGAFDSSGLLDIENDTYYECGENGVIYIVTLNTVFDKQAKTISLSPSTIKYKYVAQGYYAYGIESSPSIYGKYMYFTDNSGYLICLDLHSLEILWAYNTQDDTDSSVALEVTDKGVFVYTANEVDIRRQDADSNIRKFDGLTGELLWQIDVPTYFVDVINGGALASPIIGKHDMEDIVIFNICKTKQDSIWAGRLIAINKESGQIEWEYISGYSWSSPVVVYTEDNKGYIVYCEHNGIISLLDGASGTLLNQVTLSEGRLYRTIEASPAVYGNMIVVGTYAEKIYGIRIK